MAWTRARRTTRPRAGGRRSAWRIAALALIIAAACFGIGYLVSVVVLFPREPAPDSGVPVPELAGRTVEAAREELAAVGLAIGTVREVRTPDEASGVIVAQAPVAGQQLRPGGTVDLGVSAGPPRLVLPDLAGMTGPGAVAVLARLGLASDTVRESTARAAAGRVLRSIPAAGDSVDASVRVTLYISDGPAILVPEPTGGDSTAIQP